MFGPSDRPLSRAISCSHSLMLSLPFCSACAHRSCFRSRRSIPPVSQNSARTLAQICLPRTTSPNMLSARSETTRAMTRRTTWTSVCQDCCVRISVAPKLPSSRLVAAVNHNAPLRTTHAQLTDDVSLACLQSIASYMQCMPTFSRVRGDVPSRRSNKICSPAQNRKNSGA